MTLKEWQTKTGTKNSVLGRMTDIHESFFTKFHRGERCMSYGTALRVSQATNGEVTLIDLLVTAPSLSHQPQPVNQP